MTTSSEDAAYAAQSNVPEIIAVCIVPFVIASVFVFARLYSRAVIIRKMGHDDIWIAISWVFSVNINPYYLLTNNLTDFFTSQCGIKHPAHEIWRWPPPISCQHIRSYYQSENRLCCTSCLHTFYGHNKNRHLHSLQTRLPRSN